MSVYYSEIDPFCCEWLRQLIKLGMLPDGEIDNRSIEDVRPDELREFTQCHFFAGIGGWPYALRLAGWPDDRPVWTGSCPCQPFSAAGKRAGTSDKRHLWPSFFWLISQCRPDTIIGEQVASKDALAWWDIVHTDLEAADYACGVCDTCAAGFGAPHIRQRLYWVAQSESYGRRGGCHGDTSGVRGEVQTSGRGTVDELANSNKQRFSGWRIDTGNNAENSDGCIGESMLSDRMEYAETYRRENESKDGRSPEQNDKQTRSTRGTYNTGQSIIGAMPTNGFWANPDWLWCRDKKWRPIKSCLTPLVDRLPEGMVRGRDCRAIRQRLQGYGNAIVIPQAVEFVRAVMEII